MKYTQLMRVLSMSIRNIETIEVNMSDGLKFESNDNTGAFESDNGLELDDSNYVEYYAVGIKLTKILINPSNKYKEGQFIELSNEFNRPDKIIDSKTREILWEDDENYERDFKI
ncbi:hypothetical protein G7062_08060 [Erysipelothrix sp. HDW6C]|uniref:hypothetical protein n=1 Tax=Erysipelothrix sp. HDW6C TaxID=2714930 RepID=UPI00140A7EAD|nr:hypothetical protein [Erysipelothrix sp. HDW6C]QIK70247.1 hypothetical protein G7062_08060 [Erysipelothrix sp. HDW6C]